MFNLFDWLKKKKPELIINSPAVSSGALRFKLFEKWPDLIPPKIWLADVSYVLPTRKELDKTIFESPVPGYQYIPEIEDCDDFALLLHADIIRRRYDDYKAGKILKDQQYPWAFGQVWYQSPQGPHAVNVCVTRDENILFIEPQTGKIWTPDKDTGVDFIRF